MLLKKLYKTIRIFMYLPLQTTQFKNFFNKLQYVCAANGMYFKLSEEISGIGFKAMQKLHEQYMETKVIISKIMTATYDIQNTQLPMLNKYGEFNKTTCLHHVF